MKTLILLCINAAFLSNAMGAGKSLDVPIFFTDFDTFQTNVIAAEKSLPPQEASDLGSAFTYLGVLRKQISSYGLTESEFDAFVIQALNGSSPRKIILFTSGMMISEWRGMSDQLKASGFRPKPNDANQEFLRFTKALGIGFAKEYSKGGER
jgi:hypothetical protein